MRDDKDIFIRFCCSGSFEISLIKGRRDINVTMPPNVTWGREGIKFHLKRVTYHFGKQ
jgi:hypothetical protein